MNELMNSIATFTNVDFGNVRVWMDENGTAWFFGVDVCRALGYAAYRDAIRKNVDEEDIRVYEMGTLRTVYAGVHNRMQEDGVYEKGTCRLVVDGVPYDMQEGHAGSFRGPKVRSNTEYLVINESGLYQLVCGSRKPKARAFRRWVWHVVIPSIRKYGMYIQSDLLEDNERLHREIEAFRVENARLKPKAEYYDAVLSATGTTTVTVIAKQYGMTARQLNDFLHERGVQYKVDGTWVPYAKYQEAGYIEWQTTPYFHASKPGTIGEAKLAKWTPLGQKFIHDLLEEEGIKPV